jgi:hypothetical protein
MGWEGALRRGLRCVTGRAGCGGSCGPCRGIGDAERGGSAVGADFVSGIVRPDDGGARVMGASAGRVCGRGGGAAHGALGVGISAGGVRGGRVPFFALRAKASMAWSICCTQARASASVQGASGCLGRRRQRKSWTRRSSHSTGLRRLGSSGVGGFRLNTTAGFSDGARSGTKVFFPGGVPSRLLKTARAPVPLDPAVPVTGNVNTADHRRPAALPIAVCDADREREPPTEKSLFASFSSEKEDSSLSLPITYHSVRR